MDPTVDRVWLDHVPYLYVNPFLKPMYSVFDKFIDDWRLRWIFEEFVSHNPPQLALNEYDTTKGW